MSEDQDLVEYASEARRHRLRRLGGALVVLVAIVAVFGVVGKVTGAGWFGYRMWMYDPGELYVLNLGSSPYQVSVDGAEPIEVPAEDARIVKLVGGTSEVVVSDPKGEVLDRRQITIDGSDALLKVAGASPCLVAVDITSYYGGGGDREYPEILETFRDERFAYVPGTTHTVWPRKDLPPRLDPEAGRAVWFELVACELLDEEDFSLQNYMATRLQMRFEKQKERRERQRELQRKVLGQ
jgi:hypothetical protein